MDWNRELHQWQQSPVDPMVNRVLRNSMWGHSLPVVSWSAAEQGGGRVYFRCDRKQRKTMNSEGNR